MAGTPAQIARMERDIEALTARVQELEGAASKVTRIERKQLEMRTELVKRDPSVEFFKRERGKIDRRKRAMRRSRR